MSSRRSRSGGIDDGKHVQPVVEIAAELSCPRPSRRDRDSWRRRAARPRGSSACCPAARTPVPAGRAAAWTAAPAECRRLRRGTACRRCASSKRPIRCAIAPVNAPFSWPNSSLSSRPVGIAAQFNLTNVRAAPPAQVVDRARDQFLAGARLALDQHRRVGRRDDLDLLQHLPERRALADDLVEVVLRANLVFEVQLFGAQLLLQLRDLSKRQPVLHGDRYLLRHLTQQLHIVRREGVRPFAAEVQRPERAIAREDRHAADGLVPLSDDAFGNLRVLRERPEILVR